MKISNFPVKNSNTRPACGVTDRCFYCKQPLGAMHLMDCATIHKKILVKFVIEVEHYAQAEWDKNQIEYHMHQSSWCASNIWPKVLETVRRYKKKQGCLCGGIKFEYMKDLSEPFVEAEEGEEPKFAPLNGEERMVYNYELGEQALVVVETPCYPNAFCAAITRKNCAEGYLADRNRQYFKTAEEAIFALGERVGMKSIAEAE